jgi:hypothetical protein
LLSYAFFIQIVHKPISAALEAQVLSSIPIVSFLLSFTCLIQNAHKLCSFYAIMLEYVMFEWISMKACHGLHEQMI